MYVVVSIGQIQSYGPHYVSAMNLHRDYGLTHLTVDEVMRRWESFSYRHKGDWLSPNKELVEECFDVKLEEI